MKTMILAAALFLIGCNMPPAIYEGNFVPSPVIDYGSIDMGLSISFKVDECMDDLAAPGLADAKALLAHYGITLNYDDNAKLTMDCTTEKTNGNDWVGQSKPGQGSVFKTDFLQTADLPTVAHTIAHEVGHMLGAIHVPQPNALMYYRMGNGDHMTEADVESISLHEAF